MPKTNDNKANDTVLLHNVDSQCSQNTAQNTKHSKRGCRTAIRHIGLSSHTPKVIQRMLDDAEIDMLMYSINPGYDYGEGDYAYGGVDERAEVYRRCAKDGVGISVMKPFSGGQLLSRERSPFGKALTPFQCIRYALDKPGVLTALPGAQSVLQVDELLSYYERADEELDYSVISSFAPPQA